MYVCYLFTKNYVYTQALLKSLTTKNDFLKLRKNLPRPSLKMLPSALQKKGEHENKR